MTTLVTSPKKSKTGESPKKQVATIISCREKELQKMQEMLKKLRIKKPKIEIMLRQKDKELKIKERAHEKLRCELKKLQKFKEDREHEKWKKKGYPEKKRHFHLPSRVTRIGEIRVRRRSPT